MRPLWLLALNSLLGLWLGLGTPLLWAETRVRSVAPPNHQHTVTTGSPTADYCTTKGQITFTPGGDLYVCPEGGNTQPKQVTGTGGGGTFADNPVVPTATPAKPVKLGSETQYDEPGTGLVSEGPAGDIEFLLKAGTSVVFAQESTSTVDRLPRIKISAGGELTLSNGVGTSGQVAQSGGPGVAASWAAAGGGVVDKSVRVFHNAAQSIPDASGTILAFNSETYDTDTMHDNSTNNSRITFTSAGKYLVTCRIQFATSGVGTRYLTIRLNGTTDIASSGGHAMNSANTARLNTTNIFSYAANDYVEAKVFQDSGGALDVAAVTDGISPYCEAVRVGS